MPRSLEPPLYARTNDGAAFAGKTVLLRVEKRT